MGQEDILKFLEGQKQPLTRGEIAKAMNESKDKISKLLNRLLIYKEIKCIEIDRFQAMARCGCRRRMRLYYSN